MGGDGENGARRAQTWGGTARSMRQKHETKACALGSCLAIPRVTAMCIASCVAMAVATAELRLQLPV